MQTEQQSVLCESKGDQYLHGSFSFIIIIVAVVFVVIIIIILGGGGLRERNSKLK